MWPQYTSCHDAAMIAGGTYCIKVVYIYIERERESERERERERERRERERACKRI